MVNLKKNTEKLNDLYFKLNGMFNGVIDVVRRVDVEFDELNLDEEFSDLGYVGAYLEEIDEYVIDKIYHGLKTDSYLYTEQRIRFAKTKIIDLKDKFAGFSEQFLQELDEIETNLISIDEEIPGLNTCCQGMRDVLKSVEALLSNTNELADDQEFDDSEEEFDCFEEEFGVLETF